MLTGISDVGGVGQTGQHSPNGISGLRHSNSWSSQMMSSQRTFPESHTQIWHGSGFHTSLSAYTCPRWVHDPRMTGKERNQM